MGYKEQPFLLSRNEFHEILGKPYGTDLFLDRPIKVLITTFDAEPATILPANTSIQEAAKIILARPSKHTYDPIIVDFLDGKLAVIDSYDILAAQNHLLGLSNQELDINQKISETLREVSFELSRSLDFDTVMDKIIEHISSIVKCGVIGLFMNQEGEFHLERSAEYQAGETKTLKKRADQLIDEYLNRPQANLHKPILLHPEGDSNSTYFGIPLRENDHLMGILILKKAQNQEFSQNEKTILYSYSNHASTALLNAQFHADIKEMAVTDPLTGMLNRHGFYLPAQQLIQQMHSSNTSISILMVDIDHFKAINDRFGHMLGDSALKKLSEIIKSVTRETDFICRYGGDEFLILLPEIEIKHTTSIAKRIMEKVDQLNFFHNTIPISLTVSIGISSNKEISGTTPKEVLEKMIERVDYALYQAKLNGRHCIFAWEREIAPIETVKGSPQIDILIKSLTKTQAELQATKLINREISNHLDIILENAGDAIILVNAINQIKMFNKSAQVIFQYSPDAILEQSIEQIFPRQGGLIQRFSDTLANRAPKEKTTITGKRRNGEEFPAELSLSQVEINNEKYLILICSDITERIHNQKEIIQKNKALNDAYFQTIYGWAQALELRDMETLGHSKRVTIITLKLAKALRVPSTEWENVQRGSLLHDIGKMAIPDRILSKSGPLDETEWEIMRQHPLIARDLLSHIEFLRPAIDIPTYHHEKWDGSGYPDGLYRTQIPLAARIFTIGDVWDALRSDRPYRQAMSEGQARRILAHGYKTHFDPQVYQAFIDLLNQGEFDFYNNNELTSLSEIQNAILEHTV